jgi:hypothetical protein
MRHWYVIASLLALASLVLPASAAEEKSEKSKTSGSQNAETSKPKLVPVGQILGEIIKMDESGRSFTLRMHQEVPQLRFNNMYRPGGGCSH